MQITLERLTGDTFSLEVDPSDTIAVVIATIVSVCVRFCMVYYFLTFKYIFIINVQSKLFKPLIKISRTLNCNEKFKKLNEN